MVTKVRALHDHSATDSRRISKQNIAMHSSLNRERLLDTQKDTLKQGLKISKAHLEQQHSTRTVRALLRYTGCTSLANAYKLLKGEITRLRKTIVQLHNIIDTQNKMILELHQKINTHIK